MQDRICRIDENLLHRAAGPYKRVIYRHSANQSGCPLYPLTADIYWDDVHVSFGPIVLKNSPVEGAEDR